MNIIQTNHRPIAYEFVLLLLLLVLLCCCYLSCSAAVTTVATVVTCLAMLLLLLLLSLATVATCYCCHYCCSLPLLLLVTLPLLATLLLLLCLQILIFQVWLNLTHSAANTWEYSLTSRRANQQIWVEYSTLENYCDPLHLSVITKLDRCTSRYTAGGISYGVIIIVIFELWVNKSVMIIIIIALSHVRK